MMDDEGWESCTYDEKLCTAIANIPQHSFSNYLCLWQKIYTEYKLQCLGKIHFGKVEMSLPEID